VCSSDLARRNTQGHVVNGYGRRAIWNEWSTKILNLQQRWFWLSGLSHTQDLISYARTIEKHERLLVPQATRPPAWRIPSTDSNLQAARLEPWVTNYQCIASELMTVLRSEPRPLGSGTQTRTIPLPYGRVSEKTHSARGTSLAYPRNRRTVRRKPRWIG